MTCIVTYPDKRGKIYLGADRRVSSEDTNYWIAPRPKITARDEVLIGFAGTADVGYAITYHFPIPELNTNRTEFSIEIVFRNALRGWLLENKFIHDEDSKHLKCYADCEGLIVYNSKVFNIEISDNIVTILQVPPMFAVGCGSTNAITIMQQMKSKNTLSVVEASLKAAADYSWGCDNNIDIIAEG